ncbi:hypothetical protein SMALA_5556 [Streptomyces malaysiensis subsp. malaysiensis]|nr:hypothetical protein SMALA_5556 [Streptomyces malaysiensis]
MVANPSVGCRVGGRPPRVSGCCGNGLPPGWGPPVRGVLFPTPPLPEPGLRPGPRWGCAPDPVPEAPPPNPRRGSAPGPRSSIAGGAEKWAHTPRTRSPNARAAGKWRPYAPDLPLKRQGNWKAAPMRARPRSSKTQPERLGGDPHTSGPAPQTPSRWGP